MCLQKYTLKTLCVVLRIFDQFKLNLNSFQIYILWLDFHFAIVSAQRVLKVKSADDMVFFIIFLFLENKALDFIKIF